MKLQSMALAAVFALGAPAAALAQAVKVEMVTNQGAIQLELDAGKAPKSVANFVQYVKSGHYNGTIFHRVIDGFMIQGGGLTGDMERKATDAAIENEARSDVTNDRGTLAMARTSDIDSATSQFFINLVDNTFLNHKDDTPSGFGYCAFGKVVEGMDVVDRIAKVKTTTRAGAKDVPVEPIEIKSTLLVH